MDEGRRTGMGGVAGVYVPVLGLTLLAFAGYIKGVPFVASLPDLTLVGALLVALSVGHRLFTARLAPLAGLGLVVVLMGTFLYGLLPATGWTDYTAAKIPQIFTLVPLCLVGGAVLLRDRRHREAWARTTVALGIAVAALALAFPSPDAAASGRFSLDGGNTINVGRAIGAAALVLAVLALSGRRRVAGSVVAAGLAILLIWTGSRGPLLAAVGGLLVVALVSRHPRKGPAIVVAGVGAVVVGIAALESGLVSERLLSLDDASAGARTALWSGTIGVIAEHPLGVGWGTVGEHLAPTFGTGGVDVYPHNLLLEVTAESGWPAGLALVVLCAVALRRQMAAAHSATELAMLALLVFHLANSMVSGDAPGNRGLWVALGAALVAAAPAGRSPTTDRALRPTDAAGR